MLHWFRPRRYEDQVEAVDNRQTVLIALIEEQPGNQIEQLETKRLHFRYTTNQTIGTVLAKQGKYEWENRWVLWANTKRFWETFLILHHENRPLLTRRRR